MAEDIQTDIEQQGASEADLTNSNAGDVLRAKRENMSMSQQEVASKLNLNVKYISAIESGEHSEISGDSYVSGYIRSYAKLLKFSEQEIQELCNKLAQQESNIVPDYMERKVAFSSESFLAKSWLLWFIVITSLLLATWCFIRQ